MMLELFATCPKGVEDLLAEELQAAGAATVSKTRAGVRFEGGLETALAACLWSRTASRVLLLLAEAETPDAEALYEAALSVSWEEHIAVDGTFAVDANVSASHLTHSHYAALKVKDAVADRLRDRRGTRPSVDTADPDVRVNLHIHRNRASLSVDLSGESLHRRGYRLEKGPAPLKENLAAAILLRAGWPERAALGQPLLDPLCGSGTLAIEAALMAADIAPAMGRERFGFTRWLGFDDSVWTRLLVEARYRMADGLAGLPVITGSDRDGQALNMARANLKRAGLSGRVAFRKGDLSRVRPPGPDPGLVVANPPYGERLGRQGSLDDLYRALGTVLRDRFRGWRAAVFTGNPELGRELGMRAVKTNVLFNGPIRCRLLQFDVEEEYFYREGKPGEGRGAQGAGRREEGIEAGGNAPLALRPPPSAAAASAGAGMFANRLRKNLKKLGTWADREGIACYRLYDADIPEYNLAVDLYGDHVHVAEYRAPAAVPAAEARERLDRALSAIREVLSVPEDRVHLKVRRRQKGADQYRRLGDGGRFLEVPEGGYRFLVNLDDYLDTGLFLDHRRTRKLIGDLSARKRFLNLFAYTGTATVYAAGGQARTTTSVDLSNTYLDWARRNMALNGLLGDHHRFVRADCIRWLEQERGRYDLIFLDPPTHSTSKAMAGDLDVQRDHVTLIRAAERLLTAKGTLLFSTNRRDFVLDHRGLGHLAVREITTDTLSRDFSRRPPPHRCFRIGKTASRGR